MDSRPLPGHDRQGFPDHTYDPNDYCREIGNPRYIMDLIKRIVTVSVETMKIVAQLPVLEVAE